MNSECKGAFQESKKQLLYFRPTLTLPDLAKPPDLYIQERRGMMHRRREGKRLVGHAVTVPTQVIEARSSPRDFCPKRLS